MDRQQTEVSALDMQDLVFMGTDVLSGQGKAIILKTGQHTFLVILLKCYNTTRKTSFDLGLAKVSKFYYEW